MFISTCDKKMKNVRVLELLLRECLLLRVLELLLREWLLLRLGLRFRELHAFWFDFASRTPFGLTLRAARLLV